MAGRHGRKAGQDGAAWDCGTADRGRGGGVGPNGAFRSRGDRRIIAVHTDPPPMRSLLSSITHSTSKEFSSSSMVSSATNHFLGKYVSAQGKPPHHAELSFSPPSATPRV